MSRVFPALVWIVLCVGVLAVGPVRSQPLASDVPAATATASATASAPAVRQPPEFAALAAKAAKVAAVHVSGSVERTLGGQSSRVGFEIWAKPPRVKQVVEGGETLLSDGRHLYLLAKPAEGDWLGRRRACRDESLYRGLVLAHLLVDAMGGYANVAASVRFEPVKDPGVADVEGAAWFRLTAATDPPHDLLKGTTSVVVGIAPDGLPRALLAQSAQGKALLVYTVSATEVAPEQLLLPAEAAAAKWLDLDDANKPLDPPAELIAPR